MRTLFRPVLFFCVLLLSCVTKGFSQSPGFDEGKHRQQELERLFRLFKAPRNTSSSGQNIDITYYELKLNLSPASQSLSGSVRIVALMTTDMASQIQLDLRDSLSIDTVKVDGQATTVTRSGSTFLIPILTPREMGTSVVLDISYHGHPDPSGFGSFIFAQHSDPPVPWIWSLSEPYGAPDWWPCKDNPGDKADSLDVWITCDQSLKAGSQGKLVSVTSDGQGKHTYHWRHRYPIANYLISVAVTNYAEISDWFKYDSDSMEVVNFVLPSDSSAVRGLVAQAVPMLQIYSDLFGLYPFVKEKYGHAQFAWGGGMEHQTMTSLVAFSEGLVAHEMAHQWFGDMITMKTWPDLWLNEGFATYVVALYQEKQYGFASYRGYMDNQMSDALHAAGSVHVTDTTNVFKLFDGNLVYAKGATVLHMLRHVVGDSAFFQSLKGYATSPQLMYKNASTGDLQQVFEDSTGVDLGTFFQQWIYGEGYPHYHTEWGWIQESGGVNVRVSLSQTTGMNPLFFKMPIDIRIYGQDTSVTFRVVNDSVSQGWVWSIPFTPDSVVVDPDNWILKDVLTTVVGFDKVGSIPSSFVLEQNYPNPFNPSTVIRYTVPEQSRVRIEVTDVLGRLISVLEDKEMVRGRYSVRWFPRGASGTYVYRMTAVPVARPSLPTILVRKMVYVK